MNCGMALTEEERQRALSRYRNMRGRRDVKVSFEPMSPVVPASNPDELAENGDAALVEESKKVSS